MAANRNGPTAGFTLIEIAIVLTIIGLILAEIWGAATQVYVNKKIADVEQNILTMTQSVRTMYPSGVSPYTTDTDITAFYLVPVSWQVKSIFGWTIFDNPWNKSILFSTAGILVN